VLIFEQVITRTTEAAGFICQLCWPIVSRLAGLYLGAHFCLFLSFVCSHFVSLSQPLPLGHGEHETQASLCAGSSILSKKSPSLRNITNSGTASCYRSAILSHRQTQTQMERAERANHTFTLSGEKRAPSGPRMGQRCRVEPMKRDMGLHLNWLVSVYSPLFAPLLLSGCLWEWTCMLVQWNACQWDAIRTASSCLQS